MALPLTQPLNNSIDVGYFIELSLCDLSISKIYLIYFPNLNRCDKK